MTARHAHNFATTPDGGAECDAAELLAAVFALLKIVCGKARDGGIARVEFIAVSCFWHSIVGTDATGRAVTPLYGWADTRPRADAEELRTALDEVAAHERTGCRFHASYWTAKLRWLKRTQKPEVNGEIKTWMGFSEYLTTHLCGEPAASISMASATGLLDTHSLSWDAELARACGVSLDQLPALAPSDAWWSVTEHALASIGGEDILRGAQVLPPIGDGAANNLGTDCTSGGEVAVMIGTSAALRVVRAAAPPSALPRSLWCYRLDEHRVVIGGALSDGGGLRAWMTNTLRIESDAATLERELAALAPDAHGLTLLPFWYGERSTGWNADARGAILGLTGDVRPIELLRATMEAVTYRLGEIVDALIACGAIDRSARFVASGGALRASGVWSQMLADVFGLRIEVSPIVEASSRGAVVLALEHRRKSQPGGELKQTVESFNTTALQGNDSVIYEPDAARHTCYADARRRQQAAYERIIADREFAPLISRAPAR
jgi:gluconokinase